MARLPYSQLVSIVALGACAAEPASLSHRYDIDVGEESYGIETMVEEFVLDGEHYVSPIISEPDGASRVAMFLDLVETEQNVSVEARGVNEDGSFGQWQPVDTTWAENSFRVMVKDINWHHGAQIRVPVTEVELIKGLTWSAIVPVPAETPEDKSGDVGSAYSALSPELASLGIITRSQWGARSTRCSSSDRSRYRMAIHHTSSGSGGDSASRMRGFQRYHMDSRGWCDIGYHFLVDIEGRIYEGRPLELLGAHTGGQNSGNVGISMIGCFEPSNCPTSSFGRNTPTEAMISSAGRLVAVLSQMYGINRTTSNIKGHKQWQGQSTDCPGINILNRFDDILGGSAGGPVTPPSDPTTPLPDDGSSCSHSFGGTYGHMACSSGYQCCDGRWKTRAGGCGTCACVETSGRSGCSGATPPPVEEPSEPPPMGASCAHTFGGDYGHTACSTSYQCCDGGWRTRGSCGSCLCVEESGSTGCTGGATAPPEEPEEPEEPTGPPAGASCSHSFGGDYANTSCSASYQCCNGSWQTRGSCGSCFCVEETGATGCGGGGIVTPPSPTGGINAGLTQSGSEIPRSGLRNSTGGVGTEQYGSIVTDANGDRWVRGKVSHFGGPNDTGVTSTETGAITRERLRSLNSPLNASRTTIQSRPDDFYYLAMRWSYSPNSTGWWRNARIVLRNPDNGRLVVVRPVDWGPHTRTGRIVDISPQAERDLGTTTDRNIDVAFAPPGTPLGPID